MASRKEDTPRRTETAARSLVFVPCPVCGRGVRLSDDHRAPDEPDAYECPACCARFYVAADSN
ncbi:MAG TPA: hypothetical protein VH968_06300 [Gaiellaceae bacterium]|jgi:hypothetical protein